jgi:hypothetical protein
MMPPRQSEYEMMWPEKGLAWGAHRLGAELFLRDFNSRSAILSRF